MTEARPPLTRRRIIDAAFGIVDESGVERLTMRKLGERLGADPMAVYHHLPNKTAVLDGIVEHMWGGVELPASSDGESWQDVIGDIFRAFRRRLLAHPRAASVVGTRPAVSPRMLALVEEILARLNAAGLGGRDAMELIDCLAGYTIGKVLAETSAALGDEGTVAAALSTVTPATHPYLARTLSEGYVLAPDEEFERGLTALIDGWKPSALHRQSLPVRGRAHLRKYSLEAGTISRMKTSIEPKINSANEIHCRAVSQTGVAARTASDIWSS